MANNITVKNNVKTKAAASTPASPASKKTLICKAECQPDNCMCIESASDCKLSDKEIISDVLGSQKSLIKLYGTALCECSDKDLRNLCAKQMQECASDQFDSFLYMNQRDLYPTEAVETKKLTEVRKKFCTCADSFKGKKASK